MKAHKASTLKSKASVSILVVVSCLFFSTTWQIHKSLLQNYGYPHLEEFNESPYLSPQPTISKLSHAHNNAQIGFLGPSGTIRHQFRYYDALLYIAMEFGRTAKSLIEVGCATDPFIKNMKWIDKRTCVAPYFVDYAKTTGNIDNKLFDADEIEKVTADFMKYDLDDYSYDLLICSQVIEHVPDPAAFTKKLVKSAKTSIISVPYKWGHCGKTCNHVTDEIGYDTILKWAEPHVPIYSSIVTEKNSGDVTNKRRLIVVFEQNETTV